MLERTSTGSGESDDEVQTTIIIPKGNLAKAMKDSGVKDEQAVLEEARHHDLMTIALDYDELKNASEWLLLKSKRLKR